MKRTFITLATALAVGAGSLSPVYADVRAKTSETQAPSDNKLSGDVKDKSSGVIDSKKMEKSTQDLLDKQDGSMKSSAGQMVRIPARARRRRIRRVPRRPAAAP